jgi:hypothetical protein
MAGSLRVQANSGKRTPVNGAKKLPNAFWHIRQWQMLPPLGSA